MTARTGAPALAVGEQLALDVGPGVDDGLQILQTPLTASPRTYWENRGPRVWEEVTVRVRYGDVSGDPVAIALFPEVRTVKLGPRNVLVEREDGTRDVKSVRLLRVRRPG